MHNAAVWLNLPDVSLMTLVNWCFRKEVACSVSQMLLCKLSHRWCHVCTTSLGNHTSPTKTSTTLCVTEDDFVAWPCTIRVWTSSYCIIWWKVNFLIEDYHRYGVECNRIGIDRSTIDTQSDSAC